MSDETRIEIGHTATVTMQWKVDGVPTNPSTQTALTITRPDGSALPGAPALASAGTDLGVVQFVFPLQTECTLCKVVWSATVGGGPQAVTSYVEVVGSHLYDLDDLRAFEWGNFTQGAAPLADPAKYPDAKLLKWRDQVADEIEEWTGTAPMERYTRAILHPSGASRRLLLDQYRPTRVLSLSNFGAVWGSNLLAELVLGISVIEHPYRAFRDPVVIEYVRGLAKVPATIEEAAKKITIMKARPSGIPPRAISITNEVGTMQLAVANYDLRRYYGVPEIDTALASIDDSIMSAV